MSQNQPIKYADVFPVGGQLASQPIAPQDAAALQCAESVVLGQTAHGTPATVMQSAADINLQCGAVTRDQMTHDVQHHGATVSEAEIGGYRIITERIGGQVIGQYGLPATEINQTPQMQDSDAVTIGEALEATALSAGNKPVDEKDAAAIQAAEERATGLGHNIPGSIGEEAQAAAAYNLKTSRLEDKKQLADVLPDATEKLACDKPATSEDAKGIIAAEIRSAPDTATHPGGVSSSIAAAARLNQHK